MKSRLGASIAPLFSGECCGSICKALTLNPKFDFFHDRYHSYRHLLQGFESSKRSLHIFVEEEDDFSELGSVTQGCGTLPKLVTEKPEHYWKSKPSKNALVSGAHLTMKSALQSLSESSLASCPKPEKKANPDTISNHRNSVHNFNGLNSVSIENVPTSVNLAQLKEAVSIFGKVSSARMRTLPSGLSCCDVEFEDEGSSRRAALVGLVNIRGNRLPVCPFRAQETCAISIQSISKKTTDPAIHSLCKSIGPLEGLARAGENAVDAIFCMKNNPDIQGILAKLNNTFVDNRRWSACLLPETSSSVVKATYDEAKRKMLYDIDDCLKAVKANHSMKRIHIEDLQYLHMLVMHLEEGM